jgi:glycosyltransferase involved in cell wall biosynthesis
VKRVLMIAFHFPPVAKSSGIQRTLRFAQFLPDLGWQPTVLSVHPRAYDRTSPDLLRDIPGSVPVVRAFGFDAVRTLSIGGRYPGFLARPDRWWPWRVGGVWEGHKLMREQRFDVLWSTFPIPTAHQIAGSLHRRSGTPWVADFRDPMAQDGYPEDPATWQAFKAIEERTVALAARSVFTTPGAAGTYRERYREVPAERFVIIENGYDEPTFAAAQTQPGDGPLLPGRLTVLHSGIVYPSERDPTQLVQALALLKARGVIDASSFCLRFRASEHDALIRELAAAAEVCDLIELRPPVSYSEALGEMLRADALLVLQASNCNAQIPAKLYEYLRAQRPILALTDPVGDTARVVRDAGILQLAPLDSAPAIAELIGRFVESAERRAGWVASADSVRRASRQARAAELARLLDEVAGERRGA